MIDTVHNPDQYMYDFKHIVGHGRKKIGLLVGAGAPVGINVGGNGEYKPLIPDVAGLTKAVRDDLPKKYRACFDGIVSDTSGGNIESILSRIRSFVEVLGDNQIYGLDSNGYREFEIEVCSRIKDVVSKVLPENDNPYSNLVSWINGVSRDFAVEIFTTNYDLLIEEAFERVKSPYFDGFSGSRFPFFDASAVSSNDLPARWARLWKLHGSINWEENSKKEIVRKGGDAQGTMVYPSHLKYDQTQSAPFSSLFERMKNFVLEKDSVLITTGFSFSDAHIAAKLDECMSENPSSAVIALQFKTLEEERFAVELGRRRPNMSVYCNDGAVINGVAAKWRLGELPSRGWDVFRHEYWKNNKFVLGDFVMFTRFLANTGGGKAISIPPDMDVVGGGDDEG